MDRIRVVHCRRASVGTYSTFWFEQVALTHLLDKIRVDNILSETDFPHVACLYENIRETLPASRALPQQYVSAFSGRIRPRCTGSTRRHRLI